MENLEKFLVRLNPNLPLMIGSAGYGRDKNDFIEQNMSYCMGGTGHKVKSK
jgi:chondroitin sulfate synthase